LQIKKKQIITQHLQKQKVLLQRCTLENTRLKNERAIDVNLLAEQRKDLIKELEDKLTLGAPVEDIQTALYKIKGHNSYLTKLGTTHLEELISPTKVSTLIISEFFRTEIPVVTQPSGSNISEFASRIVDLVPNLSSEQNLAIKSIAQKHAGDLEQHKMERSKLNEELEIKFSTRYRSKNSEIQDVLGTTQIDILENLRKNLENETYTWDTALEEMLGVLSVYQRATLTLHSEYRNANLQQLKYLWSAIYGESDVY